MKHYLLTLLFLTSLLAAACGQPGPLYLPTETPKVQAQPASITEPQTDHQLPPDPTVPESKTETDPYQ